ncbi:MAG: NAD(P)-dependent oxidoreductase [Candidatus Latescibacteria bacterium]|nr:NAD(P)-dependent oxidoreductase [Candidatus Latescibacterota bacterium]
MAKRRVVITGAAGYIAGRSLPALRERYDLGLLDVRKTDSDGNEVEGIVQADLLKRDRNVYRRHFADTDAVIHCGFTRANAPEDQYWAESDNIAMAYNVYQTCLEENVRRVVVISSNHATDFYETLIWSGRMEFVTPDMRPLSDNFYGWAKAAYELLGFAFAAGRVGNGTKLQNIQLRIGGPRDTVADNLRADNLKGMHRSLGAYLSARDQTQLLIKSIETENIEDENGIPFQIFYGISGNSHNFWSIANARRVIGYDPEDNSLIRFADRIAPVLAAAKRDNDRGINSNP